MSNGSEEEGREGWESTFGIAEEPKGVLDYCDNFFDAMMRNPQ